jgi:hypothetical protein
LQLRLDFSVTRLVFSFKHSAFGLLFIAAAFERRGCKALLNFPSNAHIYSAHLAAKKSEAAVAATTSTPSSSTKTASAEQGRPSPKVAAKSASHVPALAKVAQNSTPVAKLGVGNQLAAQTLPFPRTVGEIQFQAAMMQEALELYRYYSYVQLFVPSPYSMVLPPVPQPRGFTYYDQAAFMNAAAGLKRSQSLESFGEPTWEPAAKRSCSSSGAPF